MRMTNMFGKTLREEPAEAETVSHRLMLKAGLLHKVSAGIYSYLPLAYKSLSKISEIIRQEMDLVGAQEIKMPALQPIEIWEATGRVDGFGDALFRLYDRRKRSLVLAPTHEEIVTHIVKANVSSYRDLPIILYQIQTKFRDEPRPRAGLIRVREFDMKDAYSFDSDDDGLEVSYQKMTQVYHRVFERCGLDTIAVQADSGAIGGKDSQEFILPSETGEDTVIYCDKCKYAANIEYATSIAPPITKNDMLPIEEVATGDAGTISEVARYLDVQTRNILKTLLYLVDGELMFVVIRGDLDVNEVKLSNNLNAKDLRLASDNEASEAGVIVGTVSPIGLPDIRVIADESITEGSNFIAGANKAGYHFSNVNYARDIKAHIIADIALAQPGHMCSSCGDILSSIRGIEVGHVFKLGTFFTEQVGASYLDIEGHQKPIIMGCYGIGIGRLLAAAIEQNHDDSGIIFPHNIAPYHIHLLSLNSEREEIRAAADSLYSDFQEAGVSILYDDREESVGVKFNDADLLGLPVRIVISGRTLGSESVEIKERCEDKGYTVSISKVVEYMKGHLRDIN